MQTTSSLTSNKRSHARRATALALWFALAALLVLAAFYGQSTEEGPMTRRSTTRTSRSTGSSCTGS